jgi:hypothetical protein
LILSFSDCFKISIQGTMSHVCDDCQNLSYDGSLSGQGPNFWHMQPLSTCGSAMDAVGCRSSACTACCGEACSNTSICNICDASDIIAAETWRGGCDGENSGA